MAHDDWPMLDYAADRDTLETLQLWTQIVGKVRLALTPWLNHSWHVPLYVDARGLTTSAVPYARGLLSMGFDFVGGRLTLLTSEGGTREIALAPKPVATMFGEITGAIEALGVQVRIHAVPNELPAPIPFARDTGAREYDPEVARRFWRALIAAGRVLEWFRTGFLGKASPVHLFWGGFDLAVTRFSGRRAPPHPGGMPHLPDAVAREAYSHEVSSAGFWPGNAAYPQAAFYSYAYPAPPGFDAARVRGGEWSAALGEWLLPYAAVRDAADPEAVVLAFLEDSYAAAADAAGWDRAALECDLGEPGRVRPV